jgi:hypothetical protein
MRQRSRAQQPRRAQRKESALKLQQQATRSLSKNKHRETCRLQDKESLHLCFDFSSDKGANATPEKKSPISAIIFSGMKKKVLSLASNKILSGISVTGITKSP